MINSSTIKFFTCLFCLIIICLSPVMAWAQSHSTPGQAVNTSAYLSDSLFRKPAPSLQTRWFTFENQNGQKGAAGRANFGRKGSPAPRVKAGETFVLLDVKDSGTIRRIWSTIDLHGDPDVLRGVKLEIFWHGSKTPAVQAPFGDFFGHHHGRIVKFENVFFSSPEGRSFNCIIPMPFQKAAKIQIINESTKDITFFYEVDCTLGYPHGSDTLYFHSYWRRENLTIARRDFNILPQIKGTGRFLGCSLSIRQNPAMTNFWWGEGEVKIYLDGDTDFPTLCGTGTEDYIGTGWGQNLFSNQYQGNNFVSSQGTGMFKNAYGFYRFHVPDPVYFHRDIRVSIQALGGATTKSILDAMTKNPDQQYMKASDGSQYFSTEELETAEDYFVLVERVDDYCATSYWYMDTPQNQLAPLAPLTDRTADIPAR